MREAHLLVTICLVIFVANDGMSVLAQRQRNSACSVNSRQCAFSWECCSGCCNEGRCDTRSASCVDDKTPCQTVNCPEGESCGLVPVACFVPPCPPQPSCRSPVNPNPCTNFPCKTGEHCDLPILAQGTPPLPTCVKDSSCDDISCAPGSTCIMSGKRPECVASCDRFQCAPGSRCGLQLTVGCGWDVKCVLTPICLPVG